MFLFLNVVKLKIQIIIILCLILNPLLGNSQITFEEQRDELIDLGKSDNINAFIRQISSDSLYVLWKVREKNVISYRTDVSQYHNVEFQATYNDLENLALWITKSKKSKESSTIMIGEWKLSYVDALFGEPNFIFDSPSGYFRIDISRNVCKRFMEPKNIQKAIRKHNQRKAWEEKNKAKSKQ